MLCEAVAAAAGWPGRSLTGLLWCVSRWRMNKVHRSPPDLIIWSTR